MFKLKQIYSFAQGNCLLYFNRTVAKLIFTLHNLNNIFQNIILLFQVLYHRQLDLFQFIEDVSPLIQEASSILTNWRGAAHF